tara:strand:+ start:297 stop:722 length:426 start_codon:yes stop_codon:yes gene_type:complete
MTVAIKKQIIKIKNGSFYGTGKRKSAVAKVWLVEGKGTLVINKILGRDYLGSDILFERALAPLEAVKLNDKYDVVATVIGGGLVGQADAILLGVSRALLQVNPEYRSALKELGLLTRDSRVKERKKYGRKRARKGYQFRKR